MESQQLQAWFNIAQQVDSLLASSGARERFQQQVVEAALEWLRRYDEKQQREKARRDAVKRDGVPSGSGRLAPDPKDGSFHWSVDFHDGGPPLEAWLPAELSPDLDPDDSPPLPVPASREISLAEKYAVLAAIWDARWLGGQKINPWQEDEFGREASGYGALVRTFRPETDLAALKDEDLAIVRTWFDDVASDLGTSAQPTVNGERTKRKRPGREKADAIPSADTARGSGIAGDEAGESRMPWQAAAERMERLRQQGEQFTSQPKLAQQFGCSSGTINKAIRKTQSLHAWAKVSSATPKAQSINPMVTDNVPQATELSPENDVAIREYLERDDITQDERAVFLAKSTADQIAYLNFLADDPDARDGNLHKRILNRKP